MTKFISTKQKCFVQAISWEEYKDQRADIVDPDEAAHMDLCCLEFNYFLSLVHSERPKLYGVLAVLNAIGLSVDHKTHTLSITQQNNVGIRSYIVM